VRAQVCPPSCPPGVADEAELVRRAAHGDAVAFGALVRRHSRLLFRTARGIVRDDDDAKDVLQEACLRAWRALPRFRTEARVSTWLVRIVLNEAFGCLRRRAARARAVDPALRGDDAFDERDAPADAEAGPEAMAMRGELRRSIAAGIDGLPAIFRAVFVLRAVEELDVRETSALLGISAATVRTRFHRARRMLRDRLAPGGAGTVGGGQARSSRCTAQSTTASLCSSSGAAYPSVRMARRAIARSRSSCSGRRRISSA
jgi:RNA polymerase sigma-70 factor (ECF subfamily)